MSHIPEIRLMELGTDPGQKPTDQESDHLARCAHCSKLLEEERHLTDLLAAIGQAEVPDGFARATRQRFIQARNARSRTRAGVGLGAGLAVGLMAALGAVALVFHLFPSVPITVVVAMARLLALVVVGINVLLRTPALAAVVLAYGTVTVLFCTGLMGGLFRWTARAKQAAAK